jgi:hypothetical protein
MVVRTSLILLDRVVVLAFRTVTSHLYVFSQPLTYREKVLLILFIEELHFPVIR